MGLNFEEQVLRLESRLGIYTNLGYFIIRLSAKGYFGVFARGSRAVLQLGDSVFSFILF